MIAEGALELDGHTVEITNADKVFFPDEGFTKGDLVGYYRDIAEVAFPHLRDRLLTLQRFPDGIEADGFYQKDASDHFPDWICTTEVPRRRRAGSVDYVVLRDQAATLVYLANQGTVTFHVWPSRDDVLDQPDVMVFDLDPAERNGEIDLDLLRSTARRMRDVLEEMGLVPYLQTTGSKGYHLVVPLERGPDFDVVGAFTRRVADLLAERHPDELTTAQRKAKRGDRIFLDTGRNAFGQTFVAPYSVRARPGAPIATPIGWDELGKVEPRRYHLGNIRRRLAQKQDPWASMPDDARPLDPASRALDSLATD
ncbi:MAG: non-homologous end-joining DNA ligase [Nitriliruptorales bacterium]